MKRIVIHQALHGYSEGHRLLQGSIKLPDDCARLILRMSDLSGSNIVPGYEEYLTAYPIEPLKLYALAKTWYAAEMPRPGSVWTHTLFITEGAMSEIIDLQKLTGLFKRPSQPAASSLSKSFESYSTPIDFEADTDTSTLSTSKEIPLIDISDLIETMYREGKNNILIGSASAHAYEGALFRVWSQQWPLLRNVFSFCTGALSSRGLAGKAFDVQCAPPNLVREIISSAVAKYGQEMNLLNKSNQDQPPWFTMAVEDAISSKGSTFRKLLWEFADSPNKNEFVHFAQLIHDFLGSAERTAGEMVRIVEERFPASTAGSALKLAFFGKDSAVPGFQSLDEGEILAALASTTNHAAFDPVALDLRNRGRDLCATNAPSARQTIGKIFRSSLNPLGDEILSGMIEAISPSIARAVTSEQPQFLSTLFRAKPALGTSSELWLAAGERRRELLEALISQQKLTSDLIEQLTAALLESDSDYLIGRALDFWKEPAVFGVLNYLVRSNVGLSERVRVALSHHIASVAKWAIANQDAPQNVVLTAAHIIAPFTYQFCQIDSGVWLNTYRNLVQQGDKREGDYIATMLLTLGFQNAPPNAISLVEECFERVHKVAWDDIMPDDTWFIIDPIVPHLWWHREWDRCERLRRGLIEAFIKFRWPIYRLTDCVKSDWLLEKVVDSAKHVDGGRDFIKQLDGASPHAGL